VVSEDPLERRVRAELKRFTGWCSTKKVDCYVGEVGWPGEGADQQRWNDLAQAWYADADQAKLWVTAWATGEWWPPSYPLDIYPDHRRGPDGAGANSQATVIESHGTTPEYQRGVNVNGGEFGDAPSRRRTSPFSNAHLGRYDRDYHYDSQASFDHLASRGIRLIRLPFRWERLQPAPGGPLDQAELSRLRDAVARAGSAGLTVILDPHNYGAYYLFNGAKGVRHAIGSAKITSQVFADLWRRVSAEFRSDPTVIGYGLMNEPVGLAGGSLREQSRRWELASQEAVDAIRASGDNKLVLVPGYNHSGVAEWTVLHPRAWITDPAGAVRYEAHHYFDGDHSGRYKHSYSDEASDAEAKGF
jgi:aryl-phospho-beta-D-glucosidase BglC (GH1 family)